MQNYKKLHDLLDNPVCKTFVKNNINQDVAQIVLQNKDRLPCDIVALAQLIKCYKKAQNKLPLWVESYCMLTQKSYEQATSQEVATYKSTFIKGESLLVLAGGLGVDEWAFSKTFDCIVSVDNDADLNACATYNHKKLGIKNIERVSQNAEDFLNHNLEQFDCVYIDPDRRDPKGKRLITLQNSLPNVLELLPRLVTLAKRVVIKASPLVDIGATVAELVKVSEVQIIAVDNEVKEVVFYVEQSETQKIKVTAANNNRGVWEEFTDVLNEPSQLPENVEGYEEQYFYEPNAAILKAGLAHQLASAKGLKLLNEKTFFYTDSKYYEDFFGRVFKIEAQFAFNRKKVKNYLQHNHIIKANVAKRNFRMSVDEIRKKFGLKDGGDYYIFFTKKSEEAWVYCCTRVSAQN